MKNPSNYSEDLVVLRNVGSKPYLGRFGIVFQDTVVSDDWGCREWTPCREEFLARSSSKMVRCLFSAPANKHKAIAAFFEILEKQLKVKNKTQFGPTQIPRIMWIKPSLWWTGREMRRSLFSAVLRASIKYNRIRKNFYEALYSERLLEQTKEAVERFLAGHTVYTGNITGWHSQFYDGGIYGDGKPSKNELAELLIKPKNVNNQSI